MAARNKQLQQKLIKSARLRTQAPLFGCGAGRGLAILVLTLFATTGIAAEAVFLKLGYGGVWQFYDEPAPTSSLTSTGSSTAERARLNSVGLGDRFAIGFDLQLTKQHAFTGHYETHMAFAHRNLQMGGLGYKWYPLDWYNAPFIGAGVDYFSLSLGTLQSVDRFGLHIAYGLNIQFPENIFLIVDFKNVFFDAISNPSATERYTHFLILTASVAYRIPVGENPTATQPTAE